MSADPVPAQRQRDVDFHGDHLTTVLIPSEGMAVPVRVVCEVLDLDVQTQSERLRTHEVLSGALRIVNVRGPDGHIRTVTAILHRYIPFWLATINPGQVAPEMRHKLVRYQTEVADFLAAIYVGGAAPAARTGEPPELQQMLVTALREVALVRNALAEVQGTLTEHGEQLVSTQAAVEGVQDLQDAQEQRLAQAEGVLETIQAQLAEHTKVTPAQKVVIKNAIQRIANEHKKRTGKEIFGLLFYQFCKDLGTTKYADLPAGKYEAALAWIQRAAAQYLPDDPDGALMQETLL